MDELTPFYIAFGLGFGITMGLPVAVLLVRSWMFRHSAQALQLQRDRFEHEKQMALEQLQLNREAMQLQHELDRDRLYSKEFEVTVDQFGGDPKLGGAYMRVRLEGANGGRTYSEECVIRPSYSDEICDITETMRDRYFAWLDKTASLRAPESAKTPAEPEAATGKSFDDHMKELKSQLNQLLGKELGEKVGQVVSPSLFDDILNGQSWLLAPAIIAHLFGKKPEGGEIPFDLFTKPAREIVGVARQETEKANHKQIGTAHLLLGVLQRNTGLAHLLLDEAGVTYNSARTEMLRIMGAGNEVTKVGAQITFTRRGVDAMKQANEEREKLGHAHIEPAHLLLALLADPESISAQILMNLGAKVSDLRAKVLEFSV